MCGMSSPNRLQEVVETEPLRICGSILRPLGTKTTLIGLGKHHRQQVNFDFWLHTKPIQPI